MDNAAIKKMMQQHQHRQRAAWLRGRRFGLRLASKEVESTDYNSTVVAGLLDALCTSDQECSQLLFEWAFEKYWAVQLEPLLPDFEKAWKLLKESGPVDWGDADCTARAERASDDDTQIVSLECHFSCADDNIYVFIHVLSDYGFGKFHVRRVGRRASRVWGKSFKSLAAMRKNDFELAYGDCRDDGYALTYEEFTRKVDRGYSFGSEVYWAIWHLRALINEVAA